MAKNTTQFNLDSFEQLPDGSYRKKKTVSQPRDVKEEHFNSRPKISEKEWGNGNEAIEAYHSRQFYAERTRKITLNLFGEPMPKQSVRTYCTKAIDKKSGRHILAHFQPKEMEVRTKDYIRQIKEQLPKGFVMFENQVHITKMHFIFAPLKGFSKKKMDQIREGEMFYKTTKPDLPDNCKKLPLDSLSGLVYKDDSIIVSEDNIKKYYGTGGMIILELEGY